MKKERQRVNANAREEEKSNKIKTLERELELYKNYSEEARERLRNYQYKLEEATLEIRTLKEQYIPGGEQYIGGTPYYDSGGKLYYE